MAVELSPGKRLPTPNERIHIWLISALLVILGIALIFYQGYLIFTNDEVAEALDPTFVGMGATIEKIEPFNPEDAQPQVVLLVEDGFLAEQGILTGDVLLRVNDTAFDFETLEEQVNERLVQNERRSRLENELARNATLTLLSSIREKLQNNELVPNADVAQLEALISGYPDSDAIITGIRFYTVTDEELAQLEAQIRADIEASLPSLDEIAENLKPSREQLEAARQEVLAETIINAFLTADAPIVRFEIERAGEILTIDVPTPTSGQFELDLPIASNAEQLGLDVRVRRFPELVLNVAEDSVAAQVGLRNGDILVSINDMPYSAKQLMIENDLTLALSEQELGETLQPTLQTLLNGAFAADAPAVIEVFRKGETIRYEVPAPSEGQVLGLRIFVAEVPYFQIDPLPNSPASADIDPGSALTQVDDTIILPTMSEEFVQDLANDDDVPLSEEDFRIQVSYKELNARGGFEEATGRRVNKQVPPEFLMAYLFNFGIFVPIILVALGIFIIVIGIRLLSLNLISARWAGVIFLWLLVGLIVVSIREFYVTGAGGSLRALGSQSFKLGDALLSIVPFVVLFIPTAIAFWRLNHLMNVVFHGEETLTSRNTRFAWSLLIPTLAALILVAARPLEQTFIASLTDDRLASAQPARFVGLENYQKLLSLTFDVVDCKKPAPEQLVQDPLSRSESNFVRLLEALRFNRTLPPDVREDAADRIALIVGDEETLSPDECLKTGDGSTDWELSEDLVKQGYREATVIALPFSQRGLRILGKDAIFLKGIFNTLQFTIISVTLELVLGMIIALVVNTKFSGRGVMRTAMLVPWAIPTVVGATLWGVIMRDNQSGILNVLLNDLGLIDGNKAWLSTVGPWLTSVIAIDVWKTSPFMALLLLAGLQTIPSDIYEAASVDGASKLRQFFSITLPLLRPTIAVALVFRTLDALRVFDLFQVLLDPTSRPSMATHNYNQLIAQQQSGYASAIGVLIFMLILIFTVMYVRFVGIEQEG